MIFHFMTLFKEYLELTKPRIVTMVLVTSAMGFYLGGKGEGDIVTLIWLLAGTALTCGGSAALNNYLERDADALMHRTRNRALVTGTIDPEYAKLFGITLSLVGTVMLVVHVNLLSGFLALLTVFLYVFLYTPLKRTTPLNTVIGAIPGALPPMGGWAAATGSIGIGGWILFLIMFVWQHPHFFAIAWMYKDDYKDGGFKMLPVVDPTGESTFRAIMYTTIALIPVSFLPTLFGLSGYVYLSGAMILGLYMLCYGVKLSRSGTILDARKLLRASIVYLPVLLILIIGDKTF